MEAGQQNNVCERYTAQWYTFWFFFLQYFRFLFPIFLFLEYLISWRVRQVGESETDRKLIGTWAEIQLKNTHTKISFSKHISVLGWNGMWLMFVCSSVVLKCALVTAKKKALFFWKKWEKKWEKFQLHRIRFGNMSWAKHFLSCGGEES